MQLHTQRHLEATIHVHLQYQQDKQPAKHVSYIYYYIAYRKSLSTRKWEGLLKTTTATIILYELFYRVPADLIRMVKCNSHWVWLHGHAALHNIAVASYID